MKRQSLNVFAVQFITLYLVTYATVSLHSYFTEELHIVSKSSNKIIFLIVLVLETDLEAHSIYFFTVNIQ